MTHAYGKHRHGPQQIYRRFAGDGLIANNHLIARTSENGRDPFELRSPVPGAKGHSVGPHRAVSRRQRVSPGCRLQQEVSTVIQDLLIAAEIRQSADSSKASARGRHLAMSSVSSELESFSPYSDIAENAVREHGQRLADLLAKSPGLQVQEVSQHEDEQATRPDIERHTAPFSSNAQGSCRPHVDSTASPCSPFRIHRGKPRQRSLQPKQRKSKRPVQHRNYTAPAAPLTQNVTSSHAVAVAKQTLDLYHQQGTFFSQTMLEQLLPRLDSSMALTHAASAVSSVLRFRFRPASSVRAQGQGLRDYTNALTEIRSNLRSSEPLLLAINLLCYYELGCFGECAISDFVAICLLSSCVSC